jgi:hypothetical protein
MSMGSWFKAHRKQVITHTSIIVGFVLLTVFVSEPLFDRLERIPGEAQLQRLQLPVETNNIQYWIGIEGVTADVVHISGWAFINGLDSVDSEIYLILKSPDRTYVFTTEVVIRKDVTREFKELGLDLDYSGFKALLPPRKIANGEYTVGIYIRKGDTEALRYTSEVIKL